MFLSVLMRNAGNRTERGSVLRDSRNGSSVSEKVLRVNRLRAYFIVSAIALATHCCGAHAKLELNGLFSDHMVMQRGMEVPVWGWAEPGEGVTVVLARQEKSARADAAGKWIVRLDPMQPGAPRRMTIKGKSETLEVNDILVGEVCVASGQSNMSWPLNQAADAQKESANANSPEIRLFNVLNARAPKAPSDRLPTVHDPRIKNMNVWMPCDPDTFKEFSAVAYFFGRELHRNLHVPIGLIANAVGNTPIEAWISRDACLSRYEDRA